MLRSVIYDLRIFLTFFAILMILFSLLLGVIGVGNPNLPGAYKEYVDTYSAADEAANGPYTGQEYEPIGIFWQNILLAIQISMGNFDFQRANMLNEYENYMYWVCWFIIVVVTCIIFLNFIIAEASASYEKVASRLDPIIMKERATLVFEADEMIPQMNKNEEKYPRFIIVREME